MVTPALWRSSSETYRTSGWWVTGKALGGGIYRHISEESVGQSQALGQLS